MHTRRIMGLDPGLNHMGWGIIDVTGSKLIHVANDTVNTKVSEGLAGRLLHLHKEIARIIAEYHPDDFAVEQAFVFKDPQAAIKLGHARAAAILAAAMADVYVAEYTPNYIKKCVVGVGHAGKEQIQAMVRQLLPGCNFKSPDAADALAVAITHASLSGTQGKIKAALS